MFLYTYVQFGGDLGRDVDEHWDVSSAKIPLDLRPPPPSAAGAGASASRRNMMKMKVLVVEFVRRARMSSGFGGTLIFWDSITIVRCIRRG